MLPTNTQFLLLKLIKLLLNTVVGDYIHTIKTTLLFKSAFLDFHVKIEIISPLHCIDLMAYHCIITQRNRNIIKFR